MTPSTDFHPHPLGHPPTPDIHAQDQVQNNAFHPMQALNNTSHPMQAPTLARPRPSSPGTPLPCPHPKPTSVTFCIPTFTSRVSLLQKGNQVAFCLKDLESGSGSSKPGPSHL